MKSSDEQPIIGEIEMITDGDKEATDGSYVELGPVKQNVTIDLGAPYNIYAVVVWHYHKQARVYKDVIVQVADDPDFIKNVQTIFNNDDDNTWALAPARTEITSRPPRASSSTPKVWWAVTFGVTATATPATT